MPFVFPLLSFIHYKSRTGRVGCLRPGIPQIFPTCPTAGTGLYQAMVERLRLMYNPELPGAHQRK
jgi:hypothetical protein